MGFGAIFQGPWRGRKPRADLTGYYRTEKYRFARERMEWQLARIFLLYRLLHIFQMAGTAPDMINRLRPGAGIAILVVAAAETSWLFLRILRGRRYGGTLTASVELGTGVVMLLLASWGAPPAHRPEALAPLVFWTTDQISGAALSRDPKLLGVGTVAISGTYLAVVAGGGPGELTQSPTLIAVTGFLVLAVLIERGAAFLRRTAADLADFSRHVAEERAYLQLAYELYNHWGNTLLKVTGHDCARAGEFAELRELLVSDYGQLRAFFATGRPSDRAALLRILHREIVEIRDRRLIVEPVISEDFREYSETVPEAVQNAFGDALRAVLTNVSEHARIDHAYVRADIEEGTVRVSVTDQGRGFPEKPALRTLAHLERRLRDLDGRLTWRSRPEEDTRVTIEFPTGSTTAEEGK
ncbi:sensor histidine kinase [Streptosporangium carneum]|uniref:ATP-binding protein n=1 Tax=Streptosporangium carneum TaxID=47481 RepID=A0A9W6HWD5_9ACTN|nr:hypothetical protein [Streptosporangium carneum]GLK07011.1 hypothetical protein GCM10017600_04160 [Streptosporangium carneum]